MGIKVEFVLTLVMSSLISLLSILSIPQLSYGFPSPQPSLLDLSYSFTPSSPSPIWPGNAPFTLTPILNSTHNRFHTFISQQDISTKAAKDPSATLDASDMEHWVQRNGPVPHSSIVLLRSGWGEYYHNDPVKYLGTDSGDLDKMVFPGFGPSGIDWLVDNTSFIGIGVDTLSLEMGVRQEVYVHRILTEGNRYGLESVANMDMLPEKGFTLTVMPIKVEGGSGGPCRVVAKLG